MERGQREPLGLPDWGWKAEVGTRTWGEGYYRDLLPAVLAELDPTRAYCPGSPFSPQPDVHPNDPAHGTVHIWDVWNQLDHTVYREYWPRFVSEFGFQAPPAFSTLTRAVHDDPLRPDGPDLLSHQKAEDGNDKLARGLVGHLPAPSNFDDWHWLTSLNQARAITLGVEHFRSLAPLCSGTIWWQLNDCWPVVSWAVVDGDERRKPSWFALRAGYADRLITIQPSGGGLDVAAVNDSDQPWAGSLRLTRRAWDGQVLTQRMMTVQAAPRSVWRAAVPITLRTPADPAHELIVAELPGAARAFWFFAEDVERWDNEGNSAIGQGIGPRSAGWTVVIGSRSPPEPCCGISRCSPTACTPTPWWTTCSSRCCRRIHHGHGGWPGTGRPGALIRPRAAVRRGRATALNNPAPESPVGQGRADARDVNCGPPSSIQLRVRLQHSGRQPRPHVGGPGPEGGVRQRHTGQVGHRVDPEEAARLAEMAEGAGGVVR